jgi:hypothetical protein
LQRNYTYSKLEQSMTYEELSKYSQEDFNLWNLQTITI